MNVARLQYWLVCYRVECRWLALAEYEHILESLFVSSAVWVITSNTQLLIYHRIVQLKSDFLEVECLPE